MIRSKVGWFAACLSTLFLFACAGSVQARDIGGTISTTLTITEDSQLVDDVTCTVVGLSCIAIGASGITLDLNGFSMAGLGNSETGCSGGQTVDPAAPMAAGGTGGEAGIQVIRQTGVTIRGPGLIQRYRGAGIFLGESTEITVTGVTASTNCFSGILVGGGSGHRIEGNISVGNGNGTSPCGGI